MLSFPSPSPPPPPPPANICMSLSLSPLPLSLCLFFPLFLHLIRHSFLLFASSPSPAPYFPPDRIFQHVRIHCTYSYGEGPNETGRWDSNSRAIDYFPRGRNNNTFVIDARTRLSPPPFFHNYGINSSVRERGERKRERGYIIPHPHYGARKKINFTIFLESLCKKGGRRRGEGVRQ